MELTAIKGIGEAYGSRLQEAGIRDVAALARHDDLSTLSERTGIPTAKLAAFRAEAMALAEREVRPPKDAVRGVAAALASIVLEAQGILRERLRSRKGRAI